MVFHVTGNVLRAGAVNGSVHFHVRVNDIQVELLILQRGHKKVFLISFRSHNHRSHSRRPQKQEFLIW